MCNPTVPEDWAVRDDAEWPEHATSRLNRVSEILDRRRMRLTRLGTGVTVCDWRPLGNIAVTSNVRRGNNNTRDRQSNGRIAMVPSTGGFKGLVRDTSSQRWGYTVH